jgi:hypothetical protein
MSPQTIAENVAAQPIVRRHSDKLSALDYRCDGGLPMKWLLIFVGLVLIAAAGVGFIASLDLLTTQIGLLYAICGAVALGAGLVILSLAALAFRIDRLHGAILRHGDGARREAEVGLAPPIAIEIETRAPAPEALAKDEPAAPPTAAEGAPMEDNAEPATTLVGRYSAGGAHYSIFSDGSIEAETDQGAFRFASMSEFKAFVAAKRA